MLNLDVCQARVKSECVVFLSPFEKQLNWACVWYKSSVSRTGNFNTSAMVLFLSFETWEQPPANAVFQIR